MNFNSAVLTYLQSNDENCEALVATLKDVVHSIAPALPSSLTLDKYISPNYMGLFLNDQQADVLKKLAVTYVKEVAHMSKYFVKSRNGKEKLW